MQDGNGTSSSLTALLQSQTNSVWDSIADLPVSQSTCVTVNERLLAVGGVVQKDLKLVYRIAGNFRGLQFSRMWGFEVFRVLIFEDGR